MTVYLLDPGMRTFGGHHANTALVMTRALRDRGEVVRVLGHRDLIPGLTAEIGAEPWFAFGTYELASTDPMCWELETVLDGGELVAADLRRFDPAPGDILVWPTARPMHVLAMSKVLSEWASPLLTVVTAGLPCGSTEAFFWRFAWRRLPQGAPVVCVTTGKTMADDYAEKSGLTFRTAPNTHEGRIRNRGGVDPAAGHVVIGVLGHQHANKGTNLLPEVVRRTRGNVRWLVQDCGRDAEPILDELETLPNVRVLRRAALDWHGLLAECDALLMPYTRTTYERTHSGLVAEAIASGIPFVIPDTPALVEQASGAGCVAYEGDGVETVVHAVETLLQHYKPLAILAYHQAAHYAATNGPGNWADWLLGLAKESGVRA
ncbi:glycosyltransferase [Azospirillum sp.]|uniref:glycosyltransferase n=1 Tax=Azospirillum sp. TaxID=34012 RepID=UPI003D7080BB